MNMKEFQLRNSINKVVCDDDDFINLSKSKWYENGSGYAYCRVNKSNIRFHRVVMNAQDGDIIDHINGNRLDNRKSNLRFCTQAQNSANMKIHGRNKTGFKGVSFEQRLGTYQCSICVNGKSKRIGNYPTAEIAWRFYDKFAMDFFGEFAKLNFQDIQQTIDFIASYVPETKLSNRTHLSKSNKAGYRGVSIIKRTGKYRAQICIKGDTIYLGDFTDAMSASIAYAKAVEEHKHLTLSPL